MASLVFLDRYPSVRDFHFEDTAFYHLILTGPDILHTAERVNMTAQRSNGALPFNWLRGLKAPSAALLMGAILSAQARRFGFYDEYLTSVISVGGLNRDAFKPIWKLSQT